MNYNEALENALNWTESKPSTPNKNVAMSYIKNIPIAYYDAVGMNMPPEESLEIQIAYVRSNIIGWKGEIARKSKEILDDKDKLKEWVKELSTKLIVVTGQEL